MSDNIETLAPCARCERGYPPHDMSDFGEELVCEQCMEEMAGGSDAHDTTLTLVRTGDEWVLQGANSGVIMSGTEKECIRHAQTIAYIDAVDILDGAGRVLRRAVFSGG